MAKEIITASAIHIINCPTLKKVIKGTIKVSNVSIGLVIQGLRHLTCFNNIQKAGYIITKKDKIDGFIAENKKGEKRFVDRAQAGEIAFLAKQIDENLPLDSIIIFPPGDNDILGYNSNDPSAEYT